MSNPTETPESQALPAKEADPVAQARLNATVKIAPIDVPGAAPIPPKSSARLNATVRIAPIDVPGAVPARPAPVIRKPVVAAKKPSPIGVKPPVAAPAMPPVQTPDASTVAEAKKMTGPLNSVTGPIPDVAVLHKTGMIAEGVISDPKAEKSKTSRISLNSAIGVAPTKSAAAPLKTIRLRRPEGLPAAPAKAAAPTPAAPATTPAATPAATVTQKKTLKLQRPGGMVKKPGVQIKSPAAAPAPAPKPATPEDADVPELGDVPEIPDTPAPVAAPVAASTGEKDVPGWVRTLSMLSAVAALAMIGYAFFLVVCQSWDTVAGVNRIASYEAQEDHKFNHDAHPGHNLDEPR